MWLFTFWIDYKNQRAIQEKLMELQEYERLGEAMEEKKVTTKASNFTVFFKLILSWEFLFEFTILAIHPIPFYDV